MTRTYLGNDEETATGPSAARLKKQQFLRRSIAIYCAERGLSDDESARLYREALQRPSTISYSAVR